MATDHNHAFGHQAVTLAEPHQEHCPQSRAALRSRPFQKRKPNPTWLRHLAMASRSQLRTTSVRTTRNRTTPNYRPPMRKLAPRNGSTPLPVSVRDRKSRQRTTTARVSRLSRPYPGRDRIAPRWLPKRRPTPEVRSRLASRILPQPDLPLPMRPRQVSARPPRRPLDQKPSPRQNLRLLLTR